MKKLMIAILVFVVALAACGQEENRKPVTIKNKLTKGKQIVYVYETKHKEIKGSDKVKQILVVTNGKAKPYSLEGSTKTLDQLSKKDDKEVISYAKKADKRSFNKKKESEIESEQLLVTIESLKAKRDQKNDLNAREKKLSYLEDVKYQKPKAQQLKFNDVTKEKNGRSEIMQAPDPYSLDIDNLLSGKSKQVRSNNVLPLILSHELNPQDINKNRYAGLQDRIGESNLNIVVKLKDNESRVTFDKTK